MNASDLAPGRKGAELVDALWDAYRTERRDLHAAVAGLATHPDPVVREEALSLLLVKWVDTRHRATAATALINDEDGGVRARAALALSSVSTDETRREDALLLLRSLKDPAEEVDVRRAAYDALLLMTGETALSSRRFDPDHDVDWARIDTIVGKSSKGSASR